MSNVFWFHKWHDDRGVKCWALYLFYGYPFRISIIYTPKRTVLERRKN